MEIYSIYRIVLEISHLFSFYLYMYIPYYLHLKELKRIENSPTLNSKYFGLIIFCSSLMIKYGHVTSYVWPVWDRIINIYRRMVLLDWNIIYTTIIEQSWKLAININCNIRTLVWISWCILVNNQNTSR